MSFDGIIDRARQLCGNRVAGIFSRMVATGVMFPITESEALSKPMIGKATLELLKTIPGVIRCDQSPFSRLSIRARNKLHYADITTKEALKGAIEGPKKITDKQIEEWGARHGLSSNGVALRAFADARSLKPE